MIHKKQSMNLLERKRENSYINSTRNKYAKI